MTFEDIYECGFCKKQKSELIVPWAIYSKWLMLMHKMGNLEWGGCLSVENDSVVSCHIPEQEVTSARCEFPVTGNGVVHSHHSMGSFHSKQDDKKCRNLAIYSIVISHGGVVCTKKAPLPCGGMGHCEVEIVVDGDPTLEDIPKIKERKIETDYNRDRRMGQPQNGATSPVQNDLLDDRCDYCGAQSKEFQLIGKNLICSECINEMTKYSQCPHCEKNLSMKSVKDGVCKHCKSDIDIESIITYGGFID